MIYEPVKSDANGWLASPQSTLRLIQRAMPGAQLKRVPIVFTLDSLHHKNVPQWVTEAYLEAWAHQLSRSHLWVNPGVDYETERLVREAGGESLATWNITANATQVREGWYGRRVGLVQAMMVSSLPSWTWRKWITDCGIGVELVGHVGGLMIVEAFWWVG